MPKDRSEPTRPTRDENNAVPAALAAVGQSADALREALFMIDATEREHADRWPGLRGSEAGRFVLDRFRAECRESLAGLEAAEKWIWEGGTDLAGQAAVLVRSSERLVSLCAALLAQAVRESREG